MSLSAGRLLLVTADDYGIGPETSRGILELAVRGVVTSTVLLVNSPYAPESVRMWNRAGRPIELGWHPCLTIDAPVLSPGQVPSLVGPDGRFPTLGGLLKRLARGRVDRAEVEAEFRAQLRRFVELVGLPPANVNAHHHAHIFRPVGESLAVVLREVCPGAYVRRVIEPIRTLVRVPGARLKRAFLSRVGRRAAARQAAGGFPGNDVLIGVTDPPFVRDPRFFARWMGAAPGRFVELTCHPGWLDYTLHGRDGTIVDGQLHRRQHEYERLSDPGFLAAVRDAGFELVTATERSGTRRGVDDRVGLASVAAKARRANAAHVGLSP